LDGAQQLVGKKVEILGDGAPGGTFSALITAKNVFSAPFFYLSGQIGTQRRLHRKPSRG
jgi:hypothetical protein